MRLSISAVTAAVIGAINAEGANRRPSDRRRAWRSAPYCNLGLGEDEVPAVDRLDLDRHVTSQYTSSRVG
jgi:hypothetical protein